MPVSKSRDVFQNKGYCFNGLCLGHTSEWCRSRHKYEVCNTSHHTKLHMDAHKQEKLHKNKRNRRTCNRSVTPVRSKGPLTSMRQPPQNVARSDHRSRSKQHRNRLSQSNKSIAENSKNTVHKWAIKRTFDAAYFPPNGVGTSPHARWDSHYQVFAKLRRSTNRDSKVSNRPS